MPGPERNPANLDEVIEAQPGALFDDEIAALRRDLADLMDLRRRLRRDPAVSRYFAAGIEMAKWRLRIEQLLFERQQQRLALRNSDGSIDIAHSPGRSGLHRSRRSRNT
jgi:hypothetical protein